MLEAREDMEHESWWEIKGGSVNVWYENWTKLGPLHLVVPNEYPINEGLEDVADLIEDGKIQCYKKQLQGVSDRPWWMPTSTGQFTVNSAWQLRRQKGQIHPDFQQLWIKGVPFKISFFLWRLWKGNIPTDDNLRRMRIAVVSRCYCCINPQQQETMMHLFLTRGFAAGVWNIFMEAAGIQVHMVQLHQVIKSLWKVKCGEKLKPIIQALPAMIVWELWKRRNIMRHGGRVSFKRVVHEINNNLFYLAKMRYPWLINIPFIWPDLIDFLENYNPSIICNIVHWKFPYNRWFKCNTDGASRGNPGPSSYNFFVRNWEGDLVYAQCAKIGDTTNVVAEARGILEGTSKFYSFSELPGAGKKILNLDKNQVPNLRIRNARNGRPKGM
ncbi:uncharacterized protein LOC132613054 [Lycium barbarum]|uniref:uncharacterized protein LOC132613054 n=1 Tax=Lycium barbarum TaxID=112863 RepID=UPI00293E2043|nr:uncharacterized protein LOC132613054 [Lycium barbarum]